MTEPRRQQTRAVPPASGLALAQNCRGVGTSEAAPTYPVGVKVSQMRVAIPTQPKMLAALLLFSLVLGACGDSKVVVADPAGSKESGGLSLDGRMFWSVSVIENGVERPLVEGTRIFVAFNNGDNIGAGAGCNAMGGSYQLDDNQRLTVTEMMGTDMGCDPERHAQDEFVAATLSAQPHLTLSGDHLVIATDKVTIKFLDREIADPDRPITGRRWIVTGFIQGEVAIGMSVDTANEGWIEISEDSRLTGFNGCADFSASVEVSDGSTGGPVEGDGEIQFGELTSEDCEEPNADSVAFDVLFETDNAIFSINGPRLTLLNSQGNGVTFRADE